MQKLYKQGAGHLKVYMYYTCTVGRGLRCGDLIGVAKLCPSRGEIHEFKVSWIAIPKIGDKYKTVDWKMFLEKTIDLKNHIQISHLLCYFNRLKYGFAKYRHIGVYDYFITNYLICIFLRFIHI